MHTTRHRHRKSGRIENVKTGSRAVRPRLAEVACHMLVITLVLSACGAGADGGDSVIVRDSAGIVIVENGGDGTWAEGEAWRLAAEPALDIGVLEGAPEYRLFHVAGTVRLSDGRIVVANAGTHELRFYSSAGDHLRTVGGQGGGPGEFQSMATLAAFAGDSLLVYDFRQRRASIFDARGSLARSFSPGAADEFPSVRAVLPEGTLLASLSSSFGSDGPQTGVYRTTTVYVRYNRTGAFLDTIGAFLASPIYIDVHDNGGGFSFTSAPFAPSSSVEAGGGRLYYGQGDSYEIRVLSLTGEPLRLIRRDVPNRPVTTPDIERYKQAELDAADNENWRRRLRQMFTEMPFPETMAAYGELNVDGRGNLWVENVSPPGDEQPDWGIFDPEGRYLGTIHTPPEFTIHEIGDDYVLGTWHDEFDVEHVRLYDLIKPTG